MSDNANKFGTDMLLIQNAYQGFAKQNYTMLDNLKLGYGGTKEEMIRLINDSGILSEKISGLDGISFAQMIEAIHAVQENLGITGTTAEEAAETFSGSFDSMKASAKNLMGALTTGNSEDVEKTLDALLKTSETFLVNNFLPMLKRLFGQIPGLINDVFEQLNINPTAFWTIASAIGAIVAVIGTWKTVTTAITAAQTLLNTVLAANPIMLVVAAVGGLVAAFVYLWNNCEEFREFWVGLWESIQETLHGFFEAWELGWNMIVEFFTATIPEAWNNFQECFQLGCDTIVGFFGGLWDSICGFFGGIGDWFGDRFGEAWDNIKSAFSSVGKFFSDLWDTIKSKFTDIGTKIGDSVSGAFKAVINGALGTVESIINGFFDGINWAIDAINSIPGVDISPIGYVDLPELAEGGVLPKGKMGLLEGDGAEAVVPLEKNTGWIRRVASQLNSYQPNGTYYGSEDMAAKLDRIIILLESYFPQLLDKFDIVVEIDGDRLVAKLVPKIDSEMGRRVKNSERGLA